MSRTYLAVPERAGWVAGATWHPLGDLPGPAQLGDEHEGGLRHVRLGQWTPPCLPGLERRNRSEWCAHPSSGSPLAMQGCLLGKSIADGVSGVERNYRGKGRSWGVANIPPLCLLVR